VWSGKVANVEFTILPAWYQTVWFRILCVALFAGLLWALYQLRVRSIQRRSKQLAVINAKLETQVAENAKLYSVLQRSEAFLAQGQKISKTGSFGRRVPGEKLYWSEETYEIYELDRSVEPTVGWLIQQIHPEDRVRVQQTIESAIHQRTGFDIEYRLMTRGGSVKYLHVVVQAQENPSGELEFVGAVTDITERKRAEEALRQAQGDLARINRVTTMGELTASLAHEISQPISGAMTNANVSLRNLGSDKPDLDLVRSAVTRIVRDAQRAAEIIARIRSQFEKGVPNQESLNVNEIIPETVALLRDQAARYNISVRTELAADLPQIVGDRVQLQQVAMNLIVNSIEAMKDVEGSRELIIMSQRAENQEILVSVSDTGPGFPPQLAEQIFDPFFTTKPHGTGMGLRISRSIIESHGGRLWAGSSGRGATFHMKLPAAIPGRP
jgi:C4-dicarboxylate-specific signal transduction histidine kinase